MAMVSPLPSHLPQDPPVACQGCQLVGMGGGGKVGGELKSLERREERDSMTLTLSAECELRKVPTDFLWESRSQRRACSGHGGASGPTLLGSLASSL